MNTDTYINQAGYVESDGHRVYWEDWGNSKAAPIFFMHGGPGGGCTERDKLVFDPKIHRVIFHDQRGSGRSTPFASTQNNTTADLIQDIESIRKALGIESAYVFGGSWGSALSLLYALAHPDRVRKLFVYSVFLGTHAEIDLTNNGSLKRFMPDAWDRFIAHVPESRRSSGDEIMRFYSEQMRSADRAQALRFAQEWSIWEYSLCSINYDAAQIEADTLSDKNILALSLLETHYLLNGCFIPENHIIENLSKIKHIPCRIIQGRFDLCTPALAAYELAAAYGENARLLLVNSGHLPTDPNMKDSLVNTAREFLV
jgi:proline iminopeptidase